MVYQSRRRDAGALRAAGCYARCRGRVLRLTETRRLRVCGASVHVGTGVMRRGRFALLIAFRTIVGGGGEMRRGGGERLTGTLRETRGGIGWWIEYIIGELLLPFRWELKALSIEGNRLNSFLLFYNSDLQF